MSLWQIAASNVWRNRRRYFAYLGSSAFAVMIYFIYTALARHPQLVAGEYSGAGGVSQGMSAASVMIAGITLLFLLTSNAAFVRSRKKEFGLLSLLGLARGQLVTMILWESLLIALAAVGLGLGLGLLFLRLFFLAVSALLMLPTTLPFYAGPGVWIQTLAVFGTFFLLVSLFSLKDVLRSSVIELVRAERKPKANLTFSRWKAALGLFLVGGGYIWASLPSQTLIMLGIFPVTIMVSAGTYFLMREVNIALLSWLRRRESFFYRPGPFLGVTQLGYKLQENYRVLSQVAIAVAVVVSAMGTIYAFYVAISDDLLARFPYAYQVVELAQDRPAVAEVDRLLQKHGVTVAERREFDTVQIELFSGTGEDRHSQTGFLVPYSLYTKIRYEQGAVPLPIEQAPLQVEPYSDVFNLGFDATPASKELLIGDQHHTLVVQPDTAGPLFNLNWSIGYALVLPDAEYQSWLAASPAERRVVITTWAVQDWLGAEASAAAAELGQYGDWLGSSEFPQITAPNPILKGTLASFGIALFIGLFVSLVFLAASCSIFYFRLFTEIEEDRRYFRRLLDVGVSLRELGRVSLGQTLVIFFVPFLVGLIHSTFAMRALGTLLNRSVLHFGWLVALGYLVLYGLYFLVTYSVYWRNLAGGSQRSA